jgi:hypothetical protein
MKLNLGHIISITIILGCSFLFAYDRSHFKHWVDWDDDCQDTRIEELIDHSLKPPVFRAPKDCYIISGKWKCPYTGQVVSNPRKLDIDHIIPLAHAWNHGADQWDAIKREQFANDPENLLPVLFSENRSKGAKGIDEWVPANIEFHRDYALLWVYLKMKYQLEFSETEMKAISEMIYPERCENNEQISNQRK